MINYKDIKVGDKQIGFVRLGNQVVFPKYAANENLVLWYDFIGRTNSDTKRTIAEDLSGNGNHGELLNFAFEEGSGYQDGGLEFDGVDDYTLGDEFQFADSFTIESCFEITNEITDTVGLIGAFNHLNPVPKGVSLGLHNSNRFRLDYALNNNTRTDFRSQDNTVFLGEKYLLSATYSYEEKTFYIYKNGVFLESHKIEDGLELNLEPEVLTVGRWAMSFNSYFFNGKMFSNRIYSRALTPEEIETNYQIDKQRFNIIE